MKGETLDAYHFYQQEYDTYEQLSEAFEWEVPQGFNIAWYVCDRWADEPDRVAIYSEQPGVEASEYTFRDLKKKSDRLANYLERQGLKAGDRVGVNTPQRVETVIAHLACWKLGAVSIPLSTLFGPDALSYRLNDASVSAVVVHESNIENLREIAGDVDSLETVLTVGDASPERPEVAFTDALEQSDRKFDRVETGADDTAIILYTSGTTGDPKGVCHGHRVLLGHLPLFVTTFSNNEIRDDDVHWTPAEWAWIASLFAITFPALFYGRPVLAYNGGQFDPENAYRLIETYDITNFFAPPTALRVMRQVEDVGYDVQSIRCIGSGGESVGQDIVDWASEEFGGAAVNEGYGQTEANALIGDCNALMEFREWTMGKAGVGHDVAIVDPETADPDVPPGEIGEIAIRFEDNPVCFKRYLNKPEKTAQKRENGWLLTEDLGSMDEDGYVTFEGRKDDVIISAGYRIGPTEIEESLLDHDSVANAAVIGIPDEERGEVPKAFVVLVDEIDAGDEVREILQRHVRDRLAKYEYPREIEFVDGLPTTTTGKVRRTALREREDVE